MTERLLELTRGLRQPLVARDATFFPPTCFHDRLVEKLGDLMIAAGDLIDTIAQAGSPVALRRIESSIRSPAASNLRRPREFGSSPNRFMTLLIACFGRLPSDRHGSTETPCG